MGDATRAPEKGPPSEEPVLWYGLEQMDSWNRVAIHTRERCLFLAQTGWEVCRVFEDRKEATRWVEDAETPPYDFSVQHTKLKRQGPKTPDQKKPAPAAPPAPVVAAGPAPVITQPAFKPQVYYGMEHPRHGTRALAWSRHDADILKSIGYALHTMFTEEADGNRWKEREGSFELRRAALFGGYLPSPAPTPPASPYGEPGHGVRSPGPTIQDLLLPDTPTARGEMRYDDTIQTAFTPGGYHYETPGTRLSSSSPRYPDAVRGGSQQPPPSPQVGLPQEAPVARGGPSPRAHHNAR